MRLLILGALLGCARPPAGPPPSPDPDVCHGEKRALIVSKQLPLAAAVVSGSAGTFVLDFATTNSTIDPNAFAKPPQAIAGTNDQFESFDFFGDWGKVRLNRANHKDFAGTMPVAGLIGTDFLSQHTYTVDYARGTLHRADARSFCTDDVLRSEGLAPMSSEGYYAADPARLRDDAPNVPTIPVRVAGVVAVAQLDTAFNDTLIRHSVNINKPLLEAMLKGGAKLIKGAGIPLSTCVPGVWENTVVYRGDTRFEMLGEGGKAVRFADDATFLLKDTPPAAMKCGGIGTWSKPAAQIGASFYVDAGRLVFDPFTSRVWMPQQ
jgi:hypothetical protein